MYKFIDTERKATICLIQVHTIIVSSIQFKDIIVSSIQFKGWNLKYMSFCLCPPFKKVHQVEDTPASMSDGRERSYIMIKPDGVQRGLIGRIITRFEDKGFKMVGLNIFKLIK